MASFIKAILLLLCFSFLFSLASAQFPKRGITYNEDISITDFGGGEVFWQYNWDQNTNFAQSYTEYCVMLWSDMSDHIDTWNANVEKWFGQGALPTIHLMGFNECDDSEQSDMTPSEAAASYLQWITPFKASKGATLVGPSVTNGPTGMPWMEEFWPLCSDCQIDFAAFHWYGDCSDFEGFQQYVTAACNLVAPAKIWLTEFEGTPEGLAQSGFMSQALPWLDDNPCVDRYAWFGSADPPDRNLLVGTGPELTALGVQYVTSAFDISLEPSDH